MTRIVQDDTYKRFPGVILSAAKNLKSTMGKNTYYVYILTNWNHHVMYIGVTNDLHRRVYEHKQGLIEGFTKKYHIHKLVYCENCGEIKDAIAREKQLKGWTRKRKNELVEANNPTWEEITI